MNRRISLALVLSLVLSMAAFGIASAHAKIASSDPAAGANLKAAPAKVTLVMSEEVSDKESETYFVVTNEQGKEVGRGKLDNTDVDHKTLSGTLASGSGDGIYTVTWYAVTPDDNGKSKGSFTFGVNKAPGAQPTAAAHDESAPTAAVGATAQPTAAHSHNESPGTLPTTGASDVPVGGVLLLLALLLLVGGLALRRSRGNAR